MAKKKKPIGIDGSVITEKIETNISSNSELLKNTNNIVTNKNV